MRVVVAPDSFKGSLTAVEACQAITEGLFRVLTDVEIIEIPMADGGEGTVEALVACTGGQKHQITALGPLGQEIAACYGILGNCESTEGKTAVIEMAAAAGLSLVPPEKRNPLYTTTYGLGQLILDALARGCGNFIVGIGGSSTNDCGTGMAQAMGAKFFDDNGCEIAEPMNGSLMGKVKSIDTTCLGPRIKQCCFTAACDVTNRLLGPNGASAVYGPQKGADKKTVRILEDNMTRIIDLIEQQVGKKVRDEAGAGAAGGLGAGLMAFLGAGLEPGIDIVMRYSRFEKRIKSADLIITGEGRVDGTTISGKTISGIANVAERNSVPVIVVAGSVGPGSEKLLGKAVKSIVPICSGSVSLEEAMRQAGRFLTDAAERVFNSYLTDNDKSN